MVYGNQGLKINFKKCIMKLKQLRKVNWLDTSENAGTRHLQEANIPYNRQ
jgi:hypothetical protein